MNGPYWKLCQGTSTRHGLRSKGETKVQKAFKDKAWREWLAKQYEVGTTAAYRVVKMSATASAYVPTEYGATDAMLHHLKRQE